MWMAWSLAVDALGASDFKNGKTSGPVFEAAKYEVPRVKTGEEPERRARDGPARDDVRPRLSCRRAFPPPWRPSEIAR